jgi:hypothetical protein
MPKRKKSEEIQTSPMDTSPDSKQLVSSPKPSFTLGQVVVFKATFLKKDEQGNQYKENYTLLGKISGGLLAVKQEGDDTNLKHVLRWFYTICVEDISEEGNILYRKFIVHEPDINAL